MGRIVTVLDGAGRSVTVSNWGGGANVKALKYRGLLFFESADVLPCPLSYTSSREQLKFKLEELIQLYLVLNTMGYHLKICTISYDDVLNSIQFYQICHSIQFTLQ
jgi:hypothetical protein